LPQIQSLVEAAVIDLQLALLKRGLGLEPAAVDELKKFF
jgi:hypothetical protein